MAEPNTPMLTRRSLLGGGEETTPGTLPTISAALSSTPVFNAQMTPGEWYGSGERMPIGQYGGTIRSVRGATPGRLQFMIQPSYASQFMSLLTLCGYKLATGTYKPASSMADRKTWGFKLWEEGRVKALAGCAGNMTLTLQQGAPAQAQFDVQGIWQAVSDTSLPAAAVVNGLPWVCRGVVLTLGGAAIGLQSQVTIDVGAEVVARPDITASSGIAHFLVASRKPRITLDTEARTVAQRDAFGMLASGVEAAIAITLSDGTNSLAIAAAAVQHVAIANGERSGIRTDPLTLQCNNSSGDDDLTFTAA